MSLVSINFERAADDVPCRARILFIRYIWLGRTCGDGGEVDGACDLVSLMILVSASSVSVFSNVFSILKLTKLKLMKS